MTTYLLIAAAAVVLYPAIANRLRRNAKAEPWGDIKLIAPPPASTPTFLDATRDLANVRKRLTATGHLEDEQREAIDVLQLALTSGSDSE